MHVYPQYCRVFAVFYSRVCVTLTQWGRVTHICVGKLTIIGSDNGLSPGRCQAIIWTNVGILLIRTLETNFSEILSEIHTFSFKKMHLKMSSGKWHPFCLGLKCVINQSWRECNHKTSNWPYQGHQVPYLVPRTTDRLSSQWSNT